MSNLRKKYPELRGITSNIYFNRQEFEENGKPTVKDFKLLDLDKGKYNLRVREFTHTGRTIQLDNILREELLEKIYSNTISFTDNGEFPNLQIDILVRGGRF
jgi:hypothetical protein